MKFLNETNRFRLKILEANEYFTKLRSEQIIDQEEKEVSDDLCSSLTEESLKTKKVKTKVRYKPICGFCGKEQESEYRLKQHELLSHTPLSQLPPNEVFTCDKCGRHFKTKQSIRNHFIRAHTPKNEVFPCSICGKVNFCLFA